MNVTSVIQGVDNLDDLSVFPYAKGFHVNIGKTCIILDTPDLARDFANRILSAVDTQDARDNSDGVLVPNQESDNAS